MQPQNRIVQRLCEYVLTQFPLAKKLDLGNDGSLLESGVVDSLGVLDLVGFLETEWGITLSDEEMVSDNFASINRLASLVESRLSQEKSTWTS